MWPLLYENVEHNTRVGTYAVLIILAFSLGFLFVHQRARGHSLNPDDLISTYLATAIGGVLGARLFTALTFEWRETLADPMNLFTMNGLTYYGGVLGGVIAVLITGRIKGFLGWKLLDLLAPALVMGHAVGRMGCFFAGCCHGAPVILSATAMALLPDSSLKGQIWLDASPPFISTEFYSGVGRFQDMPLYPTQLWSTVGGLMLTVFLIWILDRKRFDGQVVALMLILEPVLRFAIELFRGDARGVAVNIPLPADWVTWMPGLSHASLQADPANPFVDIGLTTSQFMALGLIATGLAVWILQRKKGVTWKPKP